MSFKKIGFFLLISCCAGSFANTSSLHADLRYRSPTFRSSLLAQSLIYRTELSRWFDLTLGGRLEESIWDLHAFHYVAELNSPLLSFFTAGIRLSHKNQFSDGTSSSDLFIRGEFNVRLAEFISLFLGGGWTVKFTKLSNASVVPNYFASDFTDRNWALRTGAYLSFSETIHFRSFVATYEEIDTFNSNNPYVEAAFIYDPTRSPLRFHLYSRYKILLGFGRMDEFLLGAKVDVLLTR